MLTKQAEDVALWRQHRAGDRVATNKLLRRMDPYIQKRVSLYRDVPIPRPAIEGHAKSLALHAFDTYDPKKKTELSTHVVNHLQRVSRFVNQGKNIARIPEHRVLRVGTFNSVHDSLKAQLGRPPSTEELSDELGWSHREVQTMAQSLKRRALSESAMPEGAEGRFKNRNEETLSFVRFGLTPKERSAFDNLFGYKGAPQLPVDRIAKKTGMSTDAVYRLRRRALSDVRSFS